MKKQIIVVLGIIFILLIVGLSGCVDEENKIVGEWRDQDGDTHHFFSDGTYNSISGSTTQSGMWELKDEKLVFTTSGGTITYNYSFSNNDKTLTLSGPQTLILTKK